MSSRLFLSSRVPLGTKAQNPNNTITACVPFLPLQEYTLTGLKTYTQYLVSLRVFNPEGDGPETIVVVMTDEGGESRR